MSAAELSRKYLPGAISGTITASIGVLLAFQLNVNDMDARTLQAQIEKKADIEWVEKRIDESSQQQSVQNAWIIKTLDRIDKRTERLEEIQMNQ